MKPWQKWSMPSKYTAMKSHGSSCMSAVAAAWIEEISPITFASDCRRWSFS